MDEELIKYYRSFLKDSIRKVIDFSRTDQYRGIAPPPIEKPYPQNAKRVDLLPCDQFGEIGKIDLWSAIRNRESRRSYGDKPITLKELSFLLWATQGVKEKLDAGHALRVVPSAGCRHALETYLCVFNVAGLNPGVYRYRPLEHQLLFEFAGEHLKKRISDAVFGRPIRRGRCYLYLDCGSLSMEWRYGLAAHKVIAIEAGHVCQNLYLACEAIGAGMCAMAAYDQEKMDEFLGVDGEDEFAIYLASVGRKEEA